MLTVLNRHYLNLASEVFDSKRCYKPEQARVAHRKDELVKAQGKEGEAVGATKLARSLCLQFKKERRKPGKTHVQAFDYHTLVTFWFP